MEAIKEFFELVQSIDSSYQLIDVRTSEEYSLGHIKNSINIPHEKAAAMLDLISENKKLIVYCAAGVRSSIACACFKEKNVKNEIICINNTGMKEWINSNHPIEKS